jgi:adenine/guanine/hypoxanthine permease
MGLNAYFTYQVVGVHGSGSVPYRLALTAVFVEGFIFIFLSLIGMRQWLVKLVPASLKIAATAGIGLFLTLIGLSTTAGVGLISGGSSTPLELAGCPSQYLDAFGQCQSHKLLDPRVCVPLAVCRESQLILCFVKKVWIGICCGGMVTGLLMMYRVKGAIFYGIAIVSIMSWPRGTSFTAFPYTAAGQEGFDFFKKVVGFHPIQHTLAAAQWDLSAAGPKFALALFTFLYVDILDSTGTLYSMARFAGVVDVKNGSFPRSTVAYCTDAFCISIGSLFGVSPVTTFVESGAGIAEGGRTGLTAMTTGLCFLVSVFFAPIFASIPQWATGCALIAVGSSSHLFHLLNSASLTNEPRWDG